MNLSKIYFIINEILDAYIVEGIKPEHLLTFMNADEDNYKFVFNKVYRKLNLENIQFESKQLTECLQDSVRDKIGMLNDMTKTAKTNESLEKQKNKTTYNTLNSWKSAVLNSGCRYKLCTATDYKRWMAFNDENSDSNGFFTIEEEYHDEMIDYRGHGYIEV